MSDHRIQPEKVTKPIQLLAAWLVGLFTVDAAFLIAASRLPQDSLQSIALTVAAILNVPGFLWALFLLQTKFRAELQEDSYYSTYINRKTNEQVSVTRDQHLFAGIQGRLERLENTIETFAESTVKRQQEELLQSLSIGINRQLPDSDVLAAHLRSEGVKRFSWFGGDRTPPHRVVSLSDSLPRQSREVALTLASKLGFTNYSYFDSSIDEISEDVLIGAYGDKGKPISEGDLAPEA